MDFWFLITYNSCNLNTTDVRNLAESEFGPTVVAGSVIQATGTVEFEDGLWMGKHLKS